MAVTTKPIPSGTKVAMGERTLEFGKQVVEMKDSADLLDNIPALRKRLEDDGYLYLRGFHDRQAVLDGRREVISMLDEMNCLDKRFPPDEAVVNMDEESRLVDQGDHPDSPGIYDVGNHSRTILFKRDSLESRLPHYMKLISSDRFMKFFSDLMGGDSVIHTQYSIPRAVTPGDFTGAHYDIVYFGPHNDSVFTCWTPLGDIPMEMGTLAVLLGSHKFEKIRQTYGKMHTTRDMIEGWFSTDPIEMVEKFGGMWATTNFSAGDIVLFSMYFMHGSTNNTTSRYRISSDTRYQLKAKVARDVPKEPGVQPAEVKSMKKARAEWGL